MEEDQLLQLEKAALDVMSPPHTVSSESRKHAEAIFMELRKSRLPYGSCKFILENSSSDFVLFQAVSTICEASMREWSLLPAREREELHSYLLNYLTTHTQLTAYVRGQVVHTIALLVKRGSLEVGGSNVLETVFSEVSQLLLTSVSPTMRHLACSLLTALLTEFSNSSGCSNIGLPLELHLKAKRAVEAEQLQKVLLLSTKVLQRYLDHTPSSDEDSALLSNFLQLTSQILNWDFQQLNMFRTNTTSLSDPSHVILQPPKSYAPTFLEPNFLHLFFRLLSLTQSNEDQLHHVVQCLTQLASLGKPILDCEQDRQLYVVNFVTGILMFVTSKSDFSPQETYGLSCILRRLVTAFPVSHFTSLNSEQLSLLVQLLSHFTVVCAQRTAGEQGEEDRLVYQESMEHFLEVWVSFLQESSFQHCLGPYSQPLTGVFDAYIQSKLSAPRGWRTVRDDDDDIIETQEDDRIVYADELSSIGCVARATLDHTLSLLAGLLDECTSEYIQLYSFAKQDPQTFASHHPSLDSLHEDLHWLVLVTGYTLCDIVEGEDVLIPYELMQHSIAKLKAQGGSCLELSPGFSINELISLDMERVEQTGLAGLDPVVRLVVAICRLCEVEKLFVAAGFLEVLSPQLCDTSVWCLSRITEPYLLFDDQSYSQVSVTLSAVFGNNSSSGEWLTVFMVNKVIFNLSVWSAEESLSLSTVQLLKSVVRSPRRASVVIQCDVLWSLMRGLSSGQQLLTTLPPRVHRLLVTSLVTCATGERKQTFLAELLGPLSDLFQSVVQSIACQPSYSQDVNVQQSLLAIFEALCGLCPSVRSDNVQDLFLFLSQFLEMSVSLAEVYCDVTVIMVLILELFALVAENFISYLNKADTVQLYSVILRLIQTYAKCSTGKYKRGSLEEEGQCEDLLLFMNMLNNLTIKDYLDLGGVGESEMDMKPVDVVIAGVSIILPLMNEEILKFPSLCKQFYVLIHYVCEDFPNRVALLQPDVFVSCVHHIQTGLTSYGADISKWSLECVESIAVHYGSTPSLHSHSQLTHSLEHLMKVLFEWMLSSLFDMELIEPATGAAFALICSCQDQYSSLAEAIVTSQGSDSQYKLTNAFNQLTPSSLPFDHSKQSRAVFRKKLAHFLPNVRGFLCFR